MQAITLALLIVVIIAAFAIKFEILRIFGNVQQELFGSDEMPTWMIRLIIAMTVVAAVLGYYLAWRYP
jgi:hypothetical protein